MTTDTTVAELMRLAGLLCQAHVKRAHAAARGEFPADRSSDPEGRAAYIALEAAIREALAPAGTLRATIAELVKNGPTMQRGTRGDGSVWMGTMREVLDDYRHAAAVEARIRDEYKAEAESLRARVAEMEAQIVAVAQRGMR